MTTVICLFVLRRTTYSREDFKMKALAEHGGNELFLHSAVLLLCSLIGPSHARRVVGNSEAATGVEQDHSAVAIDPTLEVINGFHRGPLRGIAGAHAISRPLRQYQFHDGFAPSGGRCGGRPIVRIAAATDQRRI